MRARLPGHGPARPRGPQQRRGARGSPPPGRGCGGAGPGRVQPRPHRRRRDGLRRGGRPGRLAERRGARRPGRRPAVPGLGVPEPRAPRRWHPPPGAWARGVAGDGPGSPAGAALDWRGDLHDLAGAARQRCRPCGRDDRVGTAGPQRSVTGVVVDAALLDRHAGRRPPAGRALWGGGPGRDRRERPRQLPLRAHGVLRGGDEARGGRPGPRPARADGRRAGRRPSR